MLRYCTAPTRVQAEHTSIVKALYDYDAAAAGELTIKEDDILLAFDVEQDWILVQSQGADSKAGFVPANYVEIHTGEEEEQATPVPPPIVVPPSVRGSILLLP
jgi:actin cytoskeleton-regulatory complex protein SLA1